MAYRWFVGLGLTDKVPDASPLSQNRSRRFDDSYAYQDIFDEIVLRAMKKKLIVIQIEQSRREYLGELDRAVAQDRLAHGKKSLKAKKGSPKSREIKQSTTDADSGYMVRDGKPNGFFYLDHRTVDGRHNLITGMHVTADSVHDSTPYVDRLKCQRDRFMFEVHTVGLDAGYFTAGVCHGLEQEQIYDVMSYRRPTHRKEYFYKHQYH
jgi:hypothetical protein